MSMQCEQQVSKNGLPRHFKLPRLFEKVSDSYSVSFYLFLLFLR